MEVLDQVAKDHIETLKILTFRMLTDDNQDGSVERENQVPTRDNETSEKEEGVVFGGMLASVGLEAASQLASVATDLKARRFRTEDEINNWDMESLSRKSQTIPIQNGLLFDRILIINELI